MTQITNQSMIKKKPTNIIFELVTGVTVVATLCFLVMVASMHFFDFPTAGRIVVVRSGSMEPAVPLGSLVWLRPSDFYAAGEVIAYSHPDSNNAQTVVLHRIESKIKNDTVSFRTKGDANTSVDAFNVTESDIIGKMEFQIHLVGYVVSWLRSQVGVLVTVIFPVVLFITHQIRTILS